MGEAFGAEAASTPALSIVTPAPSYSSAQQLVPYQVSIQAVGGTGTAPTWAVSSGSLPPGLSAVPAGH